MNEPKFTPAPWHVEDNGLCVCDSNRVVLFMSDRPYGNKTDRADTALIAAAPDMYNELQYICKICDTHICALCGIGKVLRKARGESEVAK